MGVYLHNMEMPRTCEDCNLESFCDLWIEARRMSNGNRAKLRHPDCPLVPVPPHGRLIDADEAIGHLFIGEQCLYSWDEIEGAIDATETIIPAEEGDG